MDQVAVHGSRLSLVKAQPPVNWPQATRGVAPIFNRNSLLCFPGDGVYRQLPLPLASNVTYNSATAVIRHAREFLNLLPWSDFGFCGTPA
jgi:hypothetical protein